MKIAERIKEARLLRGMTQEELAKKIGVTKGAIANYENGVSVPKVEFLYPLMDALGIDANFVYGVSASDSSIAVSSHERDVVFAYRAHPEMQPAVDRLLGVEIEPAALPKQA